MDICHVDQIFESSCNAFNVGSIADFKLCSGNLLNHIAEILVTPSIFKRLNACVITVCIGIKLLSCCCLGMWAVSHPSSVAAGPERDWEVQD